MKKLVLFLSCFAFLNCSKEENVIPTEQTPQYTITISSTTGGAVSTPGGTYNSGAVVTVTATPEEGYRFTGWTGSNSLDPTLTITLSQNQSIVANFERVFELENNIQGNWIIDSSSTSGKTSCNIFNLTFTNTGEFTIVYSGGIETGNYEVTSETDITLGTVGAITEIAIVDGVITFNITIVQCVVSAEGERNEEYEEGGCANFLECFSGTYVYLNPQIIEPCQNMTYEKFSNDINNKWMEYIIDRCDYDNKLCRSYYSNLTNSSDVDSGDFLVGGLYNTGYLSDTEILELGNDYVIYTYQLRRQDPNEDVLTIYIIRIGTENGLVGASSLDYEYISELKDNRQNEPQEINYVLETEPIFDTIDETANCDSCLFYDTNANRGCDNIFISIEDKVAESSFYTNNGYIQHDITIGEPISLPNNEVFYVAAEYPILEPAWATHISNWGIPSQGAIRVVLVKDPTKTGDNYNHEESPERFYLHYRYEDKRFLYAIDPKVESVPQDDTVWTYQQPNAEGIISGEINDLWASFISYVEDPESSHNALNFMERYNNTTWYDGTGQYLYLRNNTNNFLKTVEIGAQLPCFTYNTGTFNYFVNGSFTPATLSVYLLDKNNFAYNINYTSDGVATTEVVTYTLLPNNTLSEQYSLPNSESFTEIIYTISNFDTNTICP